MRIPIVGAAELTTLGDEARILDARSRSAWEKGHLLGSVNADLEIELSNPGDPIDGGRHPLPEMARWCSQLGEWGIGRDSAVVIYDASGGAMAACRCWWMLRAVGHEQVAVLDGGLEAATEAGLGTTTETVETAALGAYPIPAAGGWEAVIVSADELDAARANPETCVIDVRAAGRYRGDSDPYDPNPGHIPGALNFPYDGNLDEQGLWLPATALRERYQQLLDGRRLEDTVVYCGSGVTACHTLLALEAAGLEGAKLYVGSWSEWGRSSRSKASVVLQQGSA
ncbi:MAG: rhodanese-like domain-containing protein [Acidobacteriota bacterium]|nr:rhodanese-like domain-containing protein [Acidobacteriota bacterium]